jgi:hypothetical protein
MKHKDDDHQKITTREGELRKQAINLERKQAEITKKEIEFERLNEELAKKDSELRYLKKMIRDHMDGQIMPPHF